MKRFFTAFTVILVLILVSGIGTAFADGSASVYFTGAQIVEAGKTYTYTYKLSFSSVCAVNANIAVGGVFEKVSGGAGLFYDSIPRNTSGSLSGSITVKVKADATAGDKGTLYVKEDSKCDQLASDNNIIESPVTGSIDVPVVKAPPAPEISVAPTGYNSVALSWGAIDGASGYDIYRATSSTGSYSRITTVSSGTLKYTNSGLTTGRTYYYKVCAFLSSGSTKICGAYSSVASAKPLPIAPASLTGVSTGYNSVKLTWSAVPGASGYRVYRSTTETGTYTLVKTTSYKYFTNTGLVMGKAYFYKVRAYRNVSGTRVYGDYSSFVSVTPLLSDVTGAKAVRYSSTKIKLSWKSVSGRTRYEIWRAASEDGEYTLIGTTTYYYYYNSGLLTGTPYYYKIRAYRTVNGTPVYSSYSNIVHATP